MVFLFTIGEIVCRGTIEVYPGSPCLLFVKCLCVVCVCDVFEDEDQNVLCDHVVTLGSRSHFVYCYYMNEQVFWQYVMC